MGIFILIILFVGFNEYRLYKEAKDAERLRKEIVAKVKESYPE